MTAMRSYFILYVADQERSTAFYKAVLASEPLLHVPGMTEFTLPSGAILGLVPERRIKALLGPALPDPAAAHGIPRAELYLLLEAPEALHERALRSGAHELSAMAARDWGHTVAYSLDPDGHVIAFARRTAAN
jgi:catechol 2,3-dioxygenase-like lactoylglutathione lyase family enzyme